MFWVFILLCIVCNPTLFIPLFGILMSLGFFSFEIAIITYLHTLVPPQPTVKASVNVNFTYLIGKSMDK